MNSPNSEIILYQTEDNQTRVEVRLDGQTAWLTQAQMAGLFQTTVPNINLHLANIFQEGELSPEATIKEYLIVRPEGQRQVIRAVLHYNLEAILGEGAGSEGKVITWVHHTGVFEVVAAIAVVVERACWCSSLALVAATSPWRAMKLALCSLRHEI